MSLTDNSTADSIQLSQHGAPLEVKVIIHHQFPGVELVSPVYAGNGASCYFSPDQKVDVGLTTQASFNIDSHHESLNILMYELQRKNTDGINEEVISNEEATCIQLFVAWKIDSSEEFYVVSDLIEHDKNRVWDRIGLMELAEHCKLFNIQHSLVEYTYLMRDNTALLKRVNIITEEECYKLEITISKTSIKDDTRRPKYIGLDR
jgi:hypothetical protein